MHSLVSRFFLVFLLRAWKEEMSLGTRLGLAPLDAAKIEVIADRLSARLLILQSMFSISGVWPPLLFCFRNAIKGVACAQTSIPLRNAIKISC